MTYHLIGAGGAGMSVVGQLLVQAGHRVSGSDRSDSANLQRLKESGADVFVGHDAKQVPADAIVVVSTAINPDNPELVVARERGQEIIHRSQALAIAAQDKDFVAVAGAHGKTTTSGMLAVAFGELGRDPSRAIGGNLAGGASGAHLGTGSIFVAEADESDGSFLNYTPRVAIVTNVEPDHLDHYGSEEAFHDAFTEFARRIEFGGLLICCADSPGALELAKRSRAAGIRTWTYGRGDGLEYHAKITDQEDGPNITFRGKPIELRLSVPGEHNLLNATGALLGGIELGEDAHDMAQALRAFRGTGRRFEQRGEKAGRRVIDDYAHHPTEVRATLQTARAETERAVRVLFQPHLYSRTEMFAQEFADALALADSVVVTNVYPAREVPADGRESDAITELLPGAELVADKVAAAHRIAQLSEPGDIVLTMGAGDVTEMADVVLEQL
ncbi:UDP-N-acetylmuramate--L-alanine ligase [Trueperella bialowiezensis]|uniref:UDP-N-acetylmuramate--L-alanine ligase n=1 Tax=Trueperella bialowiezensis TaxID=312285 RepID=A0A3S4V9J8_9ACTO|nr:UDP-N-acetylmuramate--L-alanine ligase [Trueperella bialowiezensis]VEI12599.1 UDP-N-acetylmuramate--L-alanine ligase [Trueperella bialowiezensis]